MGGLRYIATVAWICLVAVAASLCYALATGHLFGDGSTLLKNPWGLATVVDAYVGFALFSCWVVWREPKPSRALVWVLLIALLGNLVSAAYVLLALRSSAGEFERFWHGARAEDVGTGLKLRTQDRRS